MFQESKLEFGKEYKLEFGREYKLEFGSVGKSFAPRNFCRRECLTVPRPTTKTRQ